MDVAYKIEKLGSSSGQPSGRAKIANSGELPLLRHLGDGTSSSSSSSKPSAEPDSSEELD